MTSVLYGQRRTIDDGLKDAEFNGLAANLVSHAVNGIEVDLLD
ncbi:hypothetical protein [Planctomicrobium sp. SH527]